MRAIFFDANGVLYYRVDKNRPMRMFLERHQLPVPPAETVREAMVDMRGRAFIGIISKAVYYDAVLAAWGVTDPRLREEGHRVQDAAQAAIFSARGRTRNVTCPQITRLQAWDCDQRGGLDYR